MGLAFVAEILIWQDLSIYGVQLPFTLLVLITLHYQQWASPNQRLLFSGCLGYALDLLTAPVAGRVVLGYILSMALLELSTRKNLPSKFRRRLFAGGALVVYWLVLNLSWGTAQTKLTPLLLTNYLLVVLTAFTIMQISLKSIGRRL